MKGSDLRAFLTKNEPVRDPLLRAYQDFVCRLYNKVLAEYQLEEEEKRILFDAMVHAYVGFVTLADPVEFREHFSEEDDLKFLRENRQSLFDMVLESITTAGFEQRNQKLQRYSFMLNDMLWKDGETLNRLLHEPGFKYEKYEEFYYKRNRTWPDAHQVLRNWISGLFPAVGVDKLVNPDFEKWDRSYRKFRSKKK